MTYKEAKDVFNDLMAPIVELQGRRTWKKEGLMKSMEVFKKMEEVFEDTPKMEPDIFMDSMEISVETPELSLNHDKMRQLREILPFLVEFTIMAENGQLTVTSEVDDVTERGQLNEEERERLNDAVDHMFGGLL